MIFISHNVEIHLLPPSPWEEESPESIWASVFMLFLIWWAIYWALLRITKRQPEYCCRVVTFIHGVLITYFTLKDIIVNKEEFDCMCNVPLNALQKYFLSIALSYFLYDLVWIILFGTEPLTIHIHHVCSVLLLLKIIISDTGGPGISYGLLGLECTNPYLQARWFLRTHGYNNTPLHKFVELWFIFLFLVIRAIGGTVLLYYVEIHPSVDITLKIAVFGIYFVSWILIIQIIQFLKKKYWNDRHQLIISTSVLSIFPYRIRVRTIPNPVPTEPVEGNNQTGN